MADIYAEEKLKIIIESFISQAKTLSSADIVDPKHRAAYRVIRNCVDVIYGLSIPEIDDEVYKTSAKLAQIHLIHNKLTPAQRGLIESWVFKSHE